MQQFEIEQNPQENVLNGTVSLEMYVSYAFGNKESDKTNQCEVVLDLSVPRVSSKQSNFFFGSNRNEPKLNLFRLFFGLFRETKQIFFRFVSVFRSGIETTETNRKNFQQTNLY
jgi:hypothetical protein